MLVAVDREVTVVEVDHRDARAHEPREREHRDAGAEREGGVGVAQVEHVGLVLSGQAVTKMDDGPELVMKSGDLFYVPPGHDSWVVGDEPYVSLHILGSEHYATPAD